MLFDKKADPHRKHLVFYDTLLYNKIKEYSRLRV